jgi:Zn-dependent M28 family amino/carboxypeptidase
MGTHERPHGDRSWASDLDDYASAAAAEQSRVLKSDQEPEKGFYYRSDHFNFAKKGVPAFDPDAGSSSSASPPGYGKTKRDEYTTTTIIAVRPGETGLGI